MTLSCVDLKWDELIFIKASLQGEGFQDEDIQNNNFSTRCSYFNLNPVLLARHFKHRPETFFHVTIRHGPMSKVENHAIHIEFQVCGSANVHSFLWVLDAPILGKDNTGQNILFADNIAKVTLSNIKVYLSLFDIVTTHQIRSHS